MNFFDIRSHKLILAPMAGITNLPFRLIIKQNGADLVCSEMISSHGLVYQGRKTLEYLITEKDEHPVSFQIFGSNPEIMAEAAKIVQSHGAPILDINMGCSVPKVIRTGSGAALMKTPALTEQILKAVRKAIDIPMTIKIRSGWDNSGDQALNIAKIAEACGVNAIAIHPRTAKQAFTGKADWSLIKKIKAEITVPVIGNGDILCPQDVMRMFDETNCDSIMIGRAALSNPWIFFQTKALINGLALPEISLKAQFDIMEKYIELSVIHLGEKKACNMMRSRLGWFSKGMPESSKFRESIKQLSTEKEMKDRLWGYFKTLFPVLR